MVPQWGGGEKKIGSTSFETEGRNFGKRRKCFQHEKVMGVFTTEVNQAAQRNHLERLFKYRL